MDDIAHPGLNQTVLTPSVYIYIHIHVLSVIICKKKYILLFVYYRKLNIMVLDNTRKRR